MQADVLGELLLLFAFAALGVALFERLRLPAIAGFLVMGALVGPGGFGWVSDPEHVRQLAELGVVFLLFEIGLELPIERLRRLWRSACAAGGLQVGITLFATAAVAHTLGFEWKTALLLGALLAMSSTALVMRVLSDRGEIDAPHGQLAVGILLFQDLCIVPFLLGVSLLASGEAVDLTRLAWSATRVGIVLAAFFFAVRFLLPRLLERAALLGSRDLFSLLVLLVVLGSAVGAEYLGLTLAVGAFVAGLVTSASPYAGQIFAEIVPLRGVLLGLFFTAIGMLFDPAAAATEWRAVSVYTGAAIVFKAGLITAIVAFALRQGLRTGCLTGISLAQTGEFSFVLAGAAAAAGLLSEPLQQVFIAGSVLSLLATPFLIQSAPRCADWLARKSEDLRRTPEVKPPALSDHAVVVGFGLAGRNLTRVLRALDISYVAVDANARSVRNAHARGEPILYGDAVRPVILEQLGVSRAKLVAVAISDPIATRRIVRLARLLNPGGVLLARTRYVSEVDALRAAGANMVVAEEIESTLDLLRHALRTFQLPDSAIARFTAELRAEDYEALRAAPAVRLDPWLTEILEQVSAEWIEVPEGIHDKASLAGLEVRARTGATVLALVRAGSTTPNPAPETPLRAGDRLLVTGTPEALERLRLLLVQSTKP